MTINNNTQTRIANGEIPIGRIVSTNVKFGAGGGRGRSRRKEKWIGKGGQVNRKGGKY